MTRIKMPARVQFDESAEKAAFEVFSYYRKLNRDFGAHGFFEQAYCKDFVEFMEEPGFAEVVSSGTAAILIALQALSLPQGSEVLVSPITDPGMISPIIFLGYKVKLVDHHPNFFHPSLASIRDRISKGTSCIILNHFSGKPVPEISFICDWARKNNISVIEDCSQAHGATVGGRKVGSFGDIACFSTMFSKTHSTGGQGGVCYTQNESLFQKLKMYANKGKPFHEAGFNEKDPGTFQFPALNLGLNEISCAIGSSTLKKVSDVNEKRRNFINGLRQKMQILQLKTELIAADPGDAPFFSMFRVSDEMSSNKMAFVGRLLEKGITLNPHYAYLVDEWAWTSPYLVDSFKTNQARKLRDSTFNLLFNENFGETEGEFIADCILETENHFRLNKDACL